MTPGYFETLAGLKFRADIASIAQSLRVIAQEIKERKEKENKKEKQDEHR